jgi:hypothetical protein
MFDWRAEADADGWKLVDGVWKNPEVAETHPDEESVYVGSGVWMKTWRYGVPPTLVEAGTR